MTTAYNPDTGETLELQGNQWVPVQAQQAAPANSDVPMGGVLSAPEGSVPADTSSITWPGNGPMDMLGAINPAFGGTTGVAAGVQGLAAAAGRYAPVASAVSATVDPIARAATAAGDLVKGAIPEAATELAMNVGSKLPYVGDAFGRGATRIKNQQLLKLAESGGAQSVGAAAAAPVRARSSLYDPKQLAEQLGITEDAITPAQRAMLSYTETQADTLAPKIGQALEGERNAVYQGTAPESVVSSWRGLDTAFTKKVATEAGIPYGQVADPGIISETRRAVGQDIGKALEENFPTDFVTLKPDYSLSRMVGAHTDTEVAPAKRVLENYGLLKDGEDVADVSLQRFTKAKAELEAISQKTSNPQVQAATNKIIQQLDNNAIDGMADIDKEWYSKLKYRYKILSKMQEPGVVSPDGMINPKSFGKQWTRGESKNMRHMNELATLSDTINAVTSKATAGTTGGRSLATDVAPAAGSAVGRLLGL